MPRRTALLPRPPPEAAVLARLHAPLLALHAAVEVDSLWTAVKDVIRAAVPAHRVTLFLGHLGMGEARLVFTDPPIPHRDRWYAERGRDNPFIPFINAHRGIQRYRFEDVLPSPRDFHGTDFYRRVAEPEGWDKGLSMLFWSREEVRAMFSVYRAPSEGAFRDSEIAVLDYLYPFIGTAIERVQLVHSERLARRGLEEFNKRLPIGLISLDWELRVVFANPEGMKACVHWNLGAEAARIYNNRDCFELPPAVLAAARGLRVAIERRNPKELQGQLGDVVQVAEPSQAGYVATVSVSNAPANTLAKPRFLIVLDAGRAVSPASSAPRRDAALRELTPREREIAILVAEGLANQEIAGRLSKSVLTIKTQLNAVFRKLGLRRRAQLITLLHER
jgi:DNA-binding CsgD family transcriptional regulator